MSRKFMMLLSVCGPLILLAGLAPAEPPAVPSGDFSLDLAFAKSAQSDTYVCTAKIADLRSGKVLAAPKVTARVGEPATVRSGVAGPGSYELALTFVVSPGRVQYEFTATRSGQVTHSQKAVITL